jgi:hypothetical protein
MSKAKTSESKKRGTSSGLKILIVLGLLLGVFFALDEIKNQWYVFDQNELHKIALEVINSKPNSTDDLVTQIVAKLDVKYPGHINKDQVRIH